MDATEAVVKCRYHCMKPGCYRHFADQESWKAHYERPGQYEGCRAPDSFLFETTRGNTVCYLPFDDKGFDHDHHYAVRVWHKREDYRERLQGMRARSKNRDPRMGLPVRTHDGLRNNYGVV